MKNGIPHGQGVLIEKGKQPSDVMFDNGNTKDLATGSNFLSGMDPDLKATFPRTTNVKKSSTKNDHQFSKSEIGNQIKYLKKSKVLIAQELLMKIIN